MISRRAFVLAAFTTPLALGTAVAGTFPSRPVRLLVPYPAGGATDFIARTIGADLSGRLGQSVVIENKPGATTVVAAELLARANPDGHTLMLADTATLATNRSLYRKLPYDPERDLMPVARVARIPLVVVVNAESPVASIADLAAQLRARPGQLDYGSPGLGSPHHLATELYLRKLGATAQHVPYRGAAPVLQDLIGGRLAFAILDLPTVRGAMGGNRLRALAVTTRRRLAALPQSPTLDESGIGGFDAFAWQGIVAPARTPVDVVTLLYRTVDETLRQPDIARKLEEGGVEPFGAAPGQFAGFISSESQRWAQVIHAAGIRLE